MRRANALMELWPWAGLAGAGLAWALDHQIGGDGVFYHCNGGTVLTTIEKWGGLGEFVSPGA